MCGARPSCSEMCSQRHTEFRIAIREECGQVKLASVVLTLAFRIRLCCTAVSGCMVVEWIHLAQ